MIDHGGRDLFGLVREAALDLEELHQDGEAEPSGAALVGERLALVGGEGPLFGELVGEPLAFS